MIGTLENRKYLNAIVIDLRICKLMKYLRQVALLERSRCIILCVCTIYANAFEILFAIAVAAKRRGRTIAQFRDRNIRRGRRQERRRQSRCTTKVRRPFPESRVW